MTWMVDTEAVPEGQWVLGGKAGTCMCGLVHPRNLAVCAVIETIHFQQLVIAISTAAYQSQRMQNWFSWSCWGVTGSPLHSELEQKRRAARFVVPVQFWGRLWLFLTALKSLFAPFCQEVGLKVRQCPIPHRVSPNTRVLDVVPSPPGCHPPSGPPPLQLATAHITCARCATLCRALRFF
mmetsp:Transcript_18353/g.29178  ORF Transcript_18353/g.29178 Transcript_18353/m.29178 type:complete len:180 (-) Transcript_18353:34-573(-)